MNPNLSKCLNLLCDEKGITLAQRAKINQYNFRDYFGFDYDPSSRHLSDKVIIKTKRDLKMMVARGPYIRSKMEPAMSFNMGLYSKYQSELQPKINFPNKIIRKRCRSHGQLKFRAKNLIKTQIINLPEQQHHLELDNDAKSLDYTILQEKLQVIDFQKLFDMIDKLNKKLDTIELLSDAKQFMHFIQSV